LEVHRICRVWRNGGTVRLGLFFQAASPAASANYPMRNARTPQPSQATKSPASCKAQTCPFCLSVPVGREAGRLFVWANNREIPGRRASQIVLPLRIPRGKRHQISSEGTYTTRFDSLHETSLVLVYPFVARYSRTSAVGRDSRQFRTFDAYLISRCRPASWAGRRGGGRSRSV
jgi:hypothetical protein